jgi:16S rRNA C1402 N4-methylase RsmH
MSELLQSYHLPVLPSEVSNYLITNPEGIYLDGTLGGGGHAEQIIKKLDKKAQYIFQKNVYDHLIMSSLFIATLLIWISF